MAIGKYIYIYITNIVAGNRKQIKQSPLKKNISTGSWKKNVNILTKTRRRPRGTAWIITTNVGSWENIVRRSRANSLFITNTTTKPRMRFRGIPYFITSIINGYMTTEGRRRMLESQNIMRVLIDRHVKLSLSPHWN